jgi:cytoskeletal protein RodZ
MESIGEKLRNAREQLGRSIEEIARETNITKRYIVALENEDFDAFPGEPYLVGFLRTYAETLGLSSDEVVALYKNFKIQEQPLPMDELIQKPNRRPFWIIPIIVLLLGGIGTGIYFLIPSIKERAVAQKESAEPEAAAEAESAGTVYEMKDEIIERRFLEGDTIIVPVGGEEYPITLAEIGDKLTVQFGDYELDLSIGEELNLDLNDDTVDDIKIFVRDIDSRSEEKATVVRFDKFTQATVAATEETDTEEESSIFKEEEDSAGEERAEEPVESVPIVGETSLASREQKPVIIFSAEEKQPLMMDFIFRGYCLVRYIIDESEREERYFQKGETFRLEARSTIRLWVSNAGAIKARLAGQDVDLGDPGEVAAKLVKWVEDSEAGTWNLTLVPVY